MATTYKLSTATDAAIDYNDVQVEKSETQPAVKAVVTPGQYFNAMAAIDDKITALQAEKAELQTECDAACAEANKVTNATNKPA